MKKQMRLLIPITKIDEEKRLVYGVMSQEVLDKSGEIIDYETAKPEFQKWSAEIYEASQGKSYGNVREMHSMSAAGLLAEPLVFNDVDKTVGCCARVVDDMAWEKCKTGTYTGFSIGGAYKARWKDSENPEVMRYTPSPVEVSLVDNPCVPTATFEAIKADGTIEMRKFKHIEEEATMTTEPTKAEPMQPVQGWQATDGSFHMTKAAALQKNAEIEAEKATAGADAALATLEAVVAKKAGDVKKDDMEEAAKADGHDDVDENADSDPKDAKAKKGTKEEEEGEDSADEADDAAKAAKAPLKKGLGTICTAANLIEQLTWLQQSVMWEADYEGDGSTLPEELKTSIKALCDWLKKLVEEETSELFPESDVEVVSKAAGADALSALSNFIKADEKLYKADGAEAFLSVLEKAGARNNKSDRDSMATIAGHADGIHKCLKDMGHEEAEKTVQGEELQKATLANAELIKRLDQYTAAFESMAKRIETLEAQPVPPKAPLREVQKRNGGIESGAGSVDAELQTLIKSGASPERVSEAMMKQAMRNPQIA